MSVCVDANITGTFRNFFEVHYKLLQRILQNSNAGGLLSGVGIFSGLLSGGLLSVQYTAVNTAYISLQYERLSHNRNK